MDILFRPLAFFFGLLFGSFLNVCIYRIPRDLSVATPRSFCPECGEQLTWLENIPLVSYVFLSGHCRWCAQPIGVRYPLVELSTAILFLFTAMKFGLTPLSLKWILFESLLIVLFWTDLEERILPDEITLGGSAAALLLAGVVAVPGSFGAMLLPHVALRWQSLMNACLGALLLTLPIWLIGAAYGRLRGREALGLGDVKLLAMLGLFLGPENGLFALLIGAVAGSIAGIAMLLWTKQDARSYEMPFGSFLCAGAILIPFLSERWHSPLAVP
jgi:leader peptidase (prepilin peptidase) / N-methyltransferase